MVLQAYLTLQILIRFILLLTTCLSRLQHLHWTPFKNTNLQNFEHIIVFHKCQGIIPACTLWVVVVCKSVMFTKHLRFSLYISLVYLSIWLSFLSHTQFTLCMSIFCTCVCMSACFIFVLPWFAALIGADMKGDNQCWCVCVVVRVFKYILCYNHDVTLSILHHKNQSLRQSSECYLKGCVIKPQMWQNSCFHLLPVATQLKEAWYLWAPTLAGGHEHLCHLLTPFIPTVFRQKGLCVLHGFDCNSNLSRWPPA